MGIGAGTAAALTAAAAVAGAGASIYGGMESANAQKSASAAIAAQNAATTQAQNVAFNQRLQATQAQTQAQLATANEEAQARNTNATAMRTAQDAALNQQNQVLASENQTATTLSGAGDTQAQALLTATNAPALSAAQTQAQQQSAALLASAQSQTPAGPTPTDPTAGTDDSVTQQAVARRLGIAATNIRNYGADVAKVGSYGQPLQAVGQAITANATGIMPAQEADKLLVSGAGVRLLPSQVAYQNATDYGNAADTAIQSNAAGQNAVSGLQYANTTTNTNLGQSDADVQAANIAAQAKANAAYQQQLAGVVSGVGQLGLYGAGYASTDAGKAQIASGVKSLFG